MAKQLQYPFLSSSTPIRTFALHLDVTGVSKDDELLSIAMVDESGHPVFFSLISPDLKKSWPKAERVTGISPSMVAGMPSSHHVLGTVQSIADGSIVVGYGIQFNTSCFPDILNVAAEVRCAQNGFALVSQRRNPDGTSTLSDLTEASEHVGYIGTGHPNAPIAKAAATMAVWQWCKSQVKQRSQFCE